MRIVPRGLAAVFRPKAAASGEQSGGTAARQSDLIGQILDAFNGGAWNTAGAFGAFGSDPHGLGLRGAVLRYPPLHRCVSLLTGVAAHVITGGGLSVRNAQTGDRVDNRAARQLLGLLTNSPDDEIPAGQWIEDVMSDLLLEGNALIYPVMTDAGAIISLERMAAWDAATVEARDGGYAYRLRPVHHPAHTRTYASRAVVHARWPLMIESWGAQRRRFAPSPVLAIRQALNVAISGDEHVRRWFRGGGGNRATVGISYPGNITPEQRQDIRTYLRSLVAMDGQGDEPLIASGGASFTNLQQTVGGQMVDRIRSFQVREVSRIYGVPAVLIDDNSATTWGSGIAELARLLWRTSAVQHINRLLDAMSLRLLPRGARLVADPMLLVRGDPADMSSLITTVQGDAQREPVMTREEIRSRLLGIDAKPDGEYSEKAPAPMPAPMPGPPMPDPMPDEGGGT